MKMGFTASTFDLLHAGHVQMLADAKDQCDYLVVGLQVDPSVDRPEKNKPVQTLVERFIQLKGVKYVDEIIWCIENTETKHRVWPYSSKTAYNVVRRVFPAYPHYFRLSRITNFFDEGWTIAQVRTWTGLSLKALNFYVGLVDVKRMGESLGRKYQ